MLEIAGIIIGIIVGIFVLIFGGRGLLDVARERRERKRQIPDNATAVVGQSESISRIKEPGFTGSSTEVTTVGLQAISGAGERKHLPCRRG